MSSFFDIYQTLGYTDNFWFQYVIEMSLRVRTLNALLRS